jgi:hypothetical protein
MIRRRRRLSSQCPANSGSTTFGRNDAVATRLTPPAPACRVSAAASGSATAVTWVPSREIV